MSDTLTSIAASDVRGQKQVDALLEREGIRRDAHLDYTCGIFDDDWCLIATGSCFHNTIRCLAVSGDHQGEGLLNRVVTHLMEVQVERGNLHVFLYTKPASAKFFGDLGFMAKKLPEVRIDCVIVPRLEKNGRIVSASTVRQAIHDGAPESVRELVPESTWRYFTSSEAEGAIRAIRAIPNTIEGD